MSADEIAHTCYNGAKLAQYKGQWQAWFAWSFPLAWALCDPSDLQ